MGDSCRKCGTSLAVVGTYDKNKGVCKKCHQARVYARRDSIRARGLCIICAEQPADEGSPTCADCKKKNLQRYYDNQEEYKETARERRRRLKRAAVTAYASDEGCECCHEKSIEFLTIDHALGNGAEHRRQLIKERGWKVRRGDMAGSHFYLWLKQSGYPPGFRVLCFNCNFSLGHFGYCPHQRKLKPLQETGT